MFAGMTRCVGRRDALLKYAFNPLKPFVARGLANLPNVPDITIFFNPLVTAYVCPFAV